MDYDIGYIRRITSKNFNTFYVSNYDWQVTMNIIESFQETSIHNDDVKLECTTKIENFLFKQTSLSILEIKILINVILQEINPDCNIIVSENKG